MGRWIGTLKNGTEACRLMDVEGKGGGELGCGSRPREEGMGCGLCGREREDKDLGWIERKGRKQPKTKKSFNKSPLEFLDRI